MGIGYECVQIMLQCIFHMQIASHQNVNLFTNRNYFIQFISKSDINLPFWLCQRKINWERTLKMGVLSVVFLLIEFIIRRKYLFQIIYCENNNCLRTYGCGLNLWPAVGYSTCHWCHVMERESFEDEEIGRILSDNFVCIKLDREERPDVDKVYMTFVQVRVSLMCPLVFPKQAFLSSIQHCNCLLLKLTGNKWRWWLAHECLADPWT